MKKPQNRTMLAHLSRVDPVLAGVIRAAGPYTVEPDLDCPPFQSLARAITYQQLNGIAAGTIFKRFIVACGREPFPSPRTVLAMPEATLRAAGLSFNKIAALKDLSAKAIEGIVPDTPTLNALDDEAIIERLTQVRGIGRWTVEMLLMFQLGRPDVLPVDDFGVRAGFRYAYGLRNMPAPKVLAAYGTRWAPYRSAAAWYMWRAVELKRAGTLPEPAEKIALPRIRRKRRKAAGRAAKRNERAPQARKRKRAGARRKR
jgi:DNA-3-methyladenine glycosylase II